MCAASNSAGVRTSSSRGRVRAADALPQGGGVDASGWSSGSCEAGPSFPSVRKRCRDTARAASGRHGGGGRGSGGGRRRSAGPARAPSNSSSTATTSPAGGGQQRGGDGGAVAGRAVHPHLAGGHLVEALRQLVQRDVHGAVDVRPRPTPGRGARPGRRPAGGGARRPARRSRPAGGRQRLAAGPALRAAGGGGGRAGRCRCAPVRAGPRPRPPASRRAGSSGCPTG